MEKKTPKALQKHICIELKSISKIIVEEKTLLNQKSKVFHQV